LIVLFASSLSNQKREGNEGEGKMKEKSSIALAFALIMLIPLFAVAPAKAFIYPDTMVDAKYESYGPHADQLINQMYLGTGPEFTALGLGQIDLTDEPLDAAWIATFANEPYLSNISMISAGGEAGYYTIDFNYNPNPKMGQIFPFVQPYGVPDPAGRPNPVWIMRSGTYVPPYPYGWPMFRHDLNHSAYSGSTGPSQNDTIWTFQMSDRISWSSPAVLNSTTSYGSSTQYQFRLYIGSVDGKIACLDALSGSLIWSFATNGVFLSSPAVADDRVFVASGDGNLSCVNAFTGALLWSRQAIHKADNSSSPTVANGRVYVGNEFNVSCFDAQTGDSLWNYTTGGYVLSSPAVANGKVYVGSNDHNVTCLDALSGTSLWNRTMGDCVVSSPAIYDNKVCVGSLDYNVSCFDAQTGDSLWNYTTNGPVLSSPAFADGKIYVGSNDGNVTCLNANSGVRIWNYTTEGKVISSPGVADSKVYVGSVDGRLYCLDAATGKSIWNCTTDGPIDSSPSVATGIVYVGSGDSKVYAFGRRIPYPYDFPPISNDVNFRLGVCSLFNRAVYAGIIGSSGVQMVTPVPPYMGSYSGGGYFWDACPGYEYNTTLADQYFNASGIFKDAATGKRFWDKNGDGVAQQVEFEAAKIIFYYRSSPQIRTLAGTMLTTQLQTMGFTVTGGMVNSGQNYQYVMLDKKYHMSTLGWIFIGPDPDFLYDLYHISSYWDDPQSGCPNTAALNDTVLNGLAASIKFSLSPAAARTAAITFQQRFWSIAAQLPLACNNAFKAMSKYYTGGTQGVPKPIDDGENQYRQFPSGTKRAWLGAANQAGFGSNSWFSKLNMYPDGYLYGTNDMMTIRYGWSETQYPQHINPFYSEWYWDSEVLGPIYDTLGYRDPYFLPNWKGDIAKSWSVSTWDDNGVSRSKVTVTIRSDAKFHDGNYVTLADVVYSIVESGQSLIALGYPPPWWWPTGSKVRSVCQLDAYTVEILYDVSSYLVEGWTLGGFYIIPKHIWKPIIDSSNPNPVNTAVPDPNIIGSGPYRFKSWTPGVALVMVSNRPGRTVNTYQPGSVAITSPGYHAWLPVMEYVYTNDGRHKYDPGTAVSFNVRTDNTWWGGSLDISDNVVITWPNTTTTVINYAMTLAAATSDVTVIGPYTWPKCKTTIEVTSTITTPGTPWTGQSFYAKYFIKGSIREDITGSTYHKDMGLSPPYSAILAAECPTPDCKVDAKDVAGAAAAFGAKPGQPKWWSVADIVHDYKINAKDIAAIAAKFGFK
jgi:outer membrane protein assembly factor BamB